MMIDWISDPHLNFLTENDRGNFYEKIKNPVIITGDIGEAQNFDKYIREMNTFSRQFVYFVLGNHDYYGGDIKKVRENCKSNDLNWLDKLPPIALKKDTYLIGVDGWADMRYGSLRFGSPIMGDHYYIDDFPKHDFERIKQIREEWADRDARTLSIKIEEVVQLGDKVIIATHIPPFRENAKYQGEISSEEFLIYFSCKAIGDVLLEKAKKYPDVQFLVLCGHSHHEAYFRPRLNLRVKTASARYYKPEINTLDLNEEFEE